MDLQKLKCLVADNLESCVRYTTDGDASISGRDRHLFAVRKFDGRTLKHVKRLFPLMNMSRKGFARLRFGDTYDNLHIRPCQVASF